VGGREADFSADGKVVQSRGGAVEECAGGRVGGKVEESRGA
jgi:hypothetical protein